jgi:hypothetical protein
VELAEEEEENIKLDICGDGTVYTLLGVCCSPFNAK